MRQPASSLTTLAMRAHVLILASLAICAHAATIPSEVVPSVQKKLVLAAKEVLNKDVPEIENISSEEAIVDEANVVKDVPNNLRIKPEDIEVKVITEEVVPIVKSISNKDTVNEITPEKEIAEKKPVFDLKNLGVPQRQEHETQNPVHYSDNKVALAAIRQTISDTQNAFNQGFQGISTNVQSWFSNNEHYSSVQNSLQNLQTQFSSQITKLNETFQGYFVNAPISTDGPLFPPQNPSGPLLKSAVSDEVPEVREATVELRQNEPAAGNSSGNPFQNFLSYWQNFQQSFTANLQNVTNTIQSYVNQQNGTSSSSAPGGGFFQNIQQNFGQNIGQNLPGFLGGQQSTSSKPEGAQSDEGATTVRPTIWQGLQNSFQNIWRPGQQNVQNDQPQPSRPIVNAIQNLIQPNKPQAAAQPAPTKPEVAAVQEGSNVVPEEKPTELQSGPIKQLVEKNPIVTKITETVQKIQDQIKPERPREEPIETEKGHKPSGAATGDNNDNNSGIVAKIELEKVEIKEPAPLVIKEEEKKEKSEIVAKKTE